MLAEKFSRDRLVGRICPAILCLFIATLAIFCTADADERSPPLVWTQFGQIRGKWSRSARNVLVANFLGIPYADPPMGPLRFRNPKPWNHTWLEIRDGTRDGPECIQLGKNGKIHGSEDCLYLNVFVPMVPNSHHHTKLPVMVFVHGGAFHDGSGNSYVYSPDYLADQEVILVTLNYRLNAFGFLSTESAVSPGNYGLKDIVTALSWIQDNIANFNGDPNSVTVFGHSAGAIAVHLLALTNKTEGLFQKYILQSGSALSTCAVHQPKAVRWLSIVFMKKLGCTVDIFDEPGSSTTQASLTKESVDTIEHHHLDILYSEEDAEHYHIDQYDSYTEKHEEDMLNCMRNLGAKDIMREMADAYVWMGQPKCIFGPTIEEETEGAILTTFPISSITQSTFRDIPFMMGVVEDEGLMKTIDILVNPRMQEELINHFGEYLPFLCDWHEVMTQHGEVFDAITEFYFSGNISVNLIPNITQVASDTIVLWPSYSALNVQSSLMNSSVYFYLFSYEGTFTNTFKSGSALHYGICHGDELNYLFPQLNHLYKDLQLYNTGNDWTMINIMTEMWVNFARNGVPEARLTPTWPDYKEKNEFLKFGDGILPDISVQTEFFPSRMEFWKTVSINMSAAPMNLGKLMKGEDASGGDTVKSFNLVCLVLVTYYLIRII